MGVIANQTHKMYFRIVSQLNDLCLGLNENNEAIMMTKESGNDSQLWLSHEGKSFINKLGKALDVKESRKERGTEVLGWTHHGGPNQQWRLNGEHLVSHVEGKDEGEGTDLVLDVAWSQTAPGSKVQVWSNNGTVAQKWTLVVDSL